MISGEAAAGHFGSSIVKGDFNADGKLDLAVAASDYGVILNGRVYLFYNDGSISPTATGADVIISGVASNDYFGTSLESGDFNADGRTDLAVGSWHSTAYIFYNDGSYPPLASSADVTITGSNEFSNSMVAGDFNFDGRVDIAIGEYGYSSYTGRAYIFYNDGSIPTTTGTADVTISAETAADEFGKKMTAGDLNSDGRTDLIISAPGYSSSTGRAYIFYNDGSIPTTAATADVKITGSSAGRRFGLSLTTGDFNTDGRTDLAVSEPNYGGGGGVVYLFYNDGSIPTTAVTADVTIANVGSLGYFGGQLAAGDMNSDGRTDLIVAGYDYSGYPGAVYIFYNDGSIPTTTAATADVTITGEATNNGFGGLLAAGDLNADGTTDLIANAVGYSSSTGRIYIFHNDGSIPTTAATADVIITGAAPAAFGNALAVGDFNADGRIDLASAMAASGLGDVYLFYNDGSIPTAAGSADVIITGAVYYDALGGALVSGDFNADGKTDLAASAIQYPAGSAVGRVYIFYNDGSYPATAASADVTITGENTSHVFGSTLARGDFNADGRTDLVVGAPGYPANTYIGYAYVFYNDGSWPASYASADQILTGEAPSRFGSAVATGDLNADGKSDVIVGGYSYSSNTGRVYLFTSEVAAASVSPGTASLKGNGKLKGNVRWK